MNGVKELVLVGNGLDDEYVDDIHDIYDIKRLHTIDLSRNKFEKTVVDI
jgi:hypothetical protein